MSTHSFYLCQEKEKRVAPFFHAEIFELKRSFSFFNFLFNYLIGIRLCVRAPLFDWASAAIVQCNFGRCRMKKKKKVYESILRWRWQELPKKKKRFQQQPGGGGGGVWAQRNNLIFFSARQKKGDVKSPCLILPSFFWFFLSTNLLFVGWQRGDYKIP